MRIYVLTLLITVFLFPAHSFAQGFLGSNISAQEKESFQRRVKGIEQFIKRFNYEENTDGKPIAPSSLTAEAFTANRKNSLVYLLDYAHYSSIGTAEEQQVFQFIDYINQADSSAIFLDFYDQEWYAVVTLAASYQGSPVKVNLSLRNELLSDRQSKWVIVGAKADFLEVEPEDQTAFLPPNASGTNFIDLADALENPSNAVAYSASHYRIDQLALFFAQLKLGLLKVNKVDSVAFHFLQATGWGFVVNEYNRIDSPNSGWLISNIFPLLNREAYKNKQLGIAISR